MPLYTIIRRVEVYLDDHLISPFVDHYGTMLYASCLMYLSDDARHRELSAAGYFDENAGEQNNTQRYAPVAQILQF